MTNAHNAAENTSNAIEIATNEVAFSLSIAQSKSPIPANTSTVEPITETTVIKNRLLNSNTFRIVDLYLKLNRFQINGILSIKTFFPDFGALGVSNTAGLFLTVFIPLNQVSNETPTRVIPKLSDSKKV